MDVVDVATEVAAREVLGDDEDSLALRSGRCRRRRGRRGWSDAQSKVLDDVGVASFLHDLALASEVLVDCDDGQHGIEGSGRRDAPSYSPLSITSLIATSRPRYSPL